MSRTYVLKTVQQIPAGKDEVWEFFRDPRNLQEITPSSLGFTVTRYDEAVEMYTGQLMEYTVRPLAGVPLYWMTEITHLEPGRYFVDEQRFGPYRFWQHQHHFREIDGGTEMTDIVHYRVPFWIVGDLVERLFVRKQLRRIFEYRYDAVVRRFGGRASQRCGVLFS